MFQREKVPGMDVVAEELIVAAEETPEPINDDNPSPKGNVMPDPLKDEVDGPVEAPRGAGTEKGGGVELTIAIEVELDIVRVVSSGPIKT